MVLERPHIRNVVENEKFYFVLLPVVFRYFLKIACMRKGTHYKCSGGCNIYFILLSLLFLDNF